MVRGKMTVNCDRDGEIAQRDNSFKSCIHAMLIFILLSVFLIIVTVAWRGFQNGAKRDGFEVSEEEIENSAKLDGQGFSTTRGKVETTSVYSTLKTKIDDGKTTEETKSFETTEIRILDETTTENRIPDEMITEKRTSDDPTTEQVTTTELLEEEFSMTEKFEIVPPSEEITTTQQILTTTDFSFSIDKEIDQSFFEDESNDDEINVKGKQKDENRSTRIFGISTPATSLNNGKLTMESTSQRSLKSFTSLQDLLVAKWSGVELTTMKSENEFDDGFLFPNEFETKKSLHREGQNSSASTVKGNLVNEKKNISENEFGENSNSTTTFMEESKNLPPQEIRESPVPVCRTGSCKQLASKILAYMNHSADPCDDFYEYSCGGLEADPQINEKILIQSVYDRIKKQARKQKQSSQIMEYYHSCIKYEENFDSYHRIDLAKESLDKIGKFYTQKDWPGNFQGFTKLFGNMMLQDRPLIFDIVPDVNEKNPLTFSLKIGLVVDENVFQSMHSENLCRDENLKNLDDHVDLGELYGAYTRCKENVTALVIAISQALKELGIFEELKNPQNMTLYLEDTVTNIYHQIIDRAFRYLPKESEIKASYRAQNYTVTSLAELEATCKLIKWRELISMVTGLNVDPDAELQIYNKEELTRVLKHLEEFSRERDLELNNALLGLYARNLYRDFVVARSPKNLEKDCFNAAVHYMQAEASSLYFASFSREKILHMKNLMINIFNELRKTMKIILKQSEWAAEWGREVLLKKLEDMRLIIPDIRLIKNDSMKLNITDSYFENSMALMKKYRWRMYNMLDKNPNDPEQIWTFFASVYQSHPRTIYGLNLIVVPFGAIDWSIVPDSLGKFNYLSFATIGNVIGREMAHNFDATGIRYWNASRDSEFALMNDNDFTKANFEDYLNCQRDTIYQDPVEMSLPLSGQRLTFRVPSLTLNDRLSDGVAMRLAHDTLARLGKDVLEERLPWLDLDLSQLYYLVYAQTYCTKASLVSSYVSLYEDPLLPSRVRAFVAASNDKNLGKSWNCPEGSQLLPTFVCGIFPHLEYRATMPDTA